MNVDKKEKFSIRKTTMGVGSLLLATTLFVSDVDRVLLSHVDDESISVVQASEVETDNYEVDVVDFKQSETSDNRLWVEYNIKIKDGESLSGKKIELPAPYMKIEGVDEEFRSNSSLIPQRQDLYIDGQKIGYFRQVSGITVVELNDNISNYDNREINIGLEFVKKSATPQSFKSDLIGKDSSLDFTGGYNNPLKTDKSLPSRFKLNYYIDSKNGTKEIPVDFISHNPSYTESDYLKKMGLVDAKEFPDKYNPMDYFSKTSVDSRFIMNRSFHYAPDDDNVNKYTISVRNSSLSSKLNLKSYVGGNGEFNNSEIKYYIKPSVFDNLNGNEFLKPKMGSMTTPELVEKSDKFYIDGTNKERYFQYFDMGTNKNFINNTYDEGIQGDYHVIGEKIESTDGNKLKFYDISNPFIEDAEGRKIYQSSEVEFSKSNEYLDGITVWSKINEISDPVFNKIADYYNQPGNLLPFVKEDGGFDRMAFQRDYSSRFREDLDNLTDEVFKLRGFSRGEEIGKFEVTRDGILYNEGVIKAPERMSVLSIGSQRPSDPNFWSNAFGDLKPGELPIAYSTIYEGSSSEDLEFGEKSKEPLVKGEYGIKKETGEHVKDPVNEVYQVGNVKKESEEIEYDTIYKYNPDLEPGEEKVIREGKNGSKERLLKYEVNTDTGEIGDVLNPNTPFETKLPVNKIVEFNPECNCEELIKESNEKISQLESLIQELEKDKESNQEKINELNSTIKELQEKSNNLQNQLDNEKELNKKQVDELNNSINDLQSQLEKANDRIDDLENKVDNLEDELVKTKEDLTNQLETERQKSEQLSNQISELEKSDKLNKEELDKLNTELERSKENMGNLKQSIDELQKDNNLKDGEINELNSKIDELNNLISETEKTLNDKINQLESDKERIIKELNDEKDKVQSLTERISNLEKENNVSKDEIVKLQESLNESKENVSKLENDLSNLEKEVSSKDEEIGKLKQDLGNVKSNLENSNNRIDELLKEINNQKEENDRLNKEQSDKITELENRLSEQIDNEKQKNQQLREEIENLRQSNDLDKQALESKISELNNEIEQSNNIINELSSEIDKLKDNEIVDKGKISELENKVSELENELNKSNQVINETIEELNGKISEIDKLNRDIQEQSELDRQKIKELEDTIDQLIKGKQETDNLNDEKISELNNKISENANALNESNSKIDKLREQLNQLVEKGIVKDGEIDELSNQLKQSQQDIDILLNLISELETKEHDNTESLNRKIVDLNDRLTAIENENKNIKEQYGRDVDNLNKELDKLAKENNDRISELNKQIDELKQKCEQQNDKVNEQSDKQTDEQSDKQTDEQSDKQTDEQSDKQTDEQSDKQTDEQSDKQTDEQSDKQTDEQSDKQTDEQSDKQSDKQTDNKPELAETGVSNENKIGIFAGLLAMAIGFIAMFIGRRKEDN